MLKVACAIIIHDGKILAAQRGARMKMPYKWEFPGGKVEEGETPRECIKREIREELNIIIDPVEQLDESIFNYGDFQITLFPFIARFISGEIQLSEHENFAWLLPGQLLSTDWAAADLPVVKALIIRFKWTQEIIQPPG